jgi:hypothetical protein
MDAIVRHNSYRNFKSNIDASAATPQSVASGAHNLHDRVSEFEGGA